MRYLTEKQFKIELDKLKIRNRQMKKKQLLKKERNKYKEKYKLPSTSKLLLLGAVFLCLEIVIFCEYVMVKFQDISAIYVLIGIPASLIPVILGYFYKSKAENTSGGIIYDTAMSQIEDAEKEETETIRDDAMG